MEFLLAFIEIGVKKCDLVKYNHEIYFVSSQQGRRRGCSRYSPHELLDTSSVLE